VRLGLGLSLFGLLFCALLLVSCGQTYELASIELTPTSPNIVGIGGTQQFVVTARYTNTKSEDVTLKSTFTIAAPNGTILVVPPSALNMSPAGMMEVIQGACTWTKSGTTTDPVYGTTPYVLKATFDKHDAIAFVSVASIAGCEYQPAN
jgi:hypothetical protein